MSAVEVRDEMRLRRSLQPPEMPRGNSTGPQHRLLVFTISEDDLHHRVLSGSEHGSDLVLLRTLSRTHPLPELTVLAELLQGKIEQREDLFPGVDPVGSHGSLPCRKRSSVCLHRDKELLTQGLILFEDEGKR